MAEEGGGVEGRAPRKVLYEIRYHATSSSATPPPSSSHLQIRKRGRSGLLWLLSVRGVNQLKEKWNEFRRPRTLRKRMSLFISPSGEHAAVAARNQITILQKDDNYINPCGIFISNERLNVFTHGAWSEPQGILGVIDDMDTLYFIKSNGEEITRTTASQLKLSNPIVDLIVQDDLNARKSCLCGFCIITTDGLLHHVEVIQDPSACIYSMPSSSNQLGPREQLPQNVSCLDFNPELSLLVLGGCAVGVGVSANPVHNSGFYALSLWRITRNLELELLFCSPHFEGLFSVPKHHIGPLTTPKVIISPQGKYVAALDVTGCLDIFNLNDEPFSLSSVSFDKNDGSEPSASLEFRRREFLNDIADVAWWSDHIIITAKRSGIVTMFDVPSGMKLLENEPVYFMPVLERIKCCQGCVFVLEGSSLKEMHSISSEHKETENSPDVLQAALESYEQTEVDRFCWNLLSFSERSVSEMYSILISNQQYQAALDFANHHKLDNDEIFKSQWLHSAQGTNEIDMFLSNIRDQIFILSECVNKVGPTEDAVKALLSYGLQVTSEYKFSDTEDNDDSFMWNFRMSRLQLLQCRDRLETFLGINMGRFSEQEYSKFRVAPLNASAITLAESGKIGALNLLFKRHPYTLSPNILVILAAVPETVPVESYSQLLPGRCPPSTIAIRDRDWVECEKMASFISNFSSSSGNSIQMRTELILKHCIGFVWPSTSELSEWYKSRARDIDDLSGQLDNCLSLVDFACHKGMVELQQFLEDISHLHQLIYSNNEEINFSMSLVVWEQLSDYEKFRMMLKGVKEETVVARLREKAIPFMQSRSCSRTSNLEIREGHLSVDCENTDSFLVRWLKEIAADNKMDICLAVIEDGCRDLLLDGCKEIDGMFRNEVEAIEVALECIYSCTVTDEWNTLASILSKLPRKCQKDKAPLGEKDFHQNHGLRGFGSPRFPYRNNQGECSEMKSNLAGSGKGISVLQSSSQYVGEINIERVENLEKRIKIAEGHVEVGRLLAYYQVPKPMSFFQGPHLDEKNVKQLLRLILSKFGRRQPGRSDNDWANMWRDMQCFQEKAFLFLDIEYMLMEFCRGLLKAGKFSLARNYLKGTGSISLTTEKAESLVIQAAREYFFSASSLACTEIWKAKECLNLFPNSESIKAEAGIIDVLTIKLPNLGVTLLPMQFRQVRNPMEYINMVIRSQTGAYLNVHELIEIAKLLGLSSQDDIAAIQEAVAREAAVNGDLQLAFDLCLVLSKKGHGPIWDLSAAIARGPTLENMDASSRKQLLGFALSYCDEESIGELLHVWNDIDMQIHFEMLIVSTGTSPSNFSDQDSSINSLPACAVSEITGQSAPSELEGTYCEGRNDAQELDLEKIKNILMNVGKDLPDENGPSLNHILRDNSRFLSFAALQLPWLLELSRKVEYNIKVTLGADTPGGKWYMSVRMQAVLCILSWLARNDIAPNDELIASLARSVMEPPTSEEEDVLGCSFLLNLMDAVRGVEIIEEQLTGRKGYREVYSIMNLGMVYSSLHSSGIESSSPDHRRMLLRHKFQEKHARFSSDEIDNMGKAQSTFWREWKSKLEEQKRLADQARQLEQIIPGVETSRFLSGDIRYIEGVIFSFIDSVKLGKKHILKEAIKLADTYGLQRAEVLLQYLACVLVSEHWTNDDILAEISEFKEDVVVCAKEIISTISSVVYPEIEGCNKQRLSYIYSILSACYLRLKQIEEPSLAINEDTEHARTVDLLQFYKLLEQECHRVSFIKDLNFKKIADLVDLNFEHFNEEVYSHISEATVSALAEMVRNLVGIYQDPQDSSLISWQTVYKYHVITELTTLETESRTKGHNMDPCDFQAFVGGLEQNYDCCRMYIRALPEEDILYVIWRYFTLCTPSNPSESLPEELTCKPCLIALLEFWIKLADENQEIVCSDLFEGKPSIIFSKKSLSKCLQVFKSLVMADEVSTSQGWRSVSDYVKLGLANGLTVDISSLCRAMVYSGCSFKAIVDVFSGGEPTISSSNIIENLSDLYINMTDFVLLNLDTDSGDRQNLHNLLSSLSKLEFTHMEDIKMVRHGVWERLSTFSDNLQMPSHVRVYALELMQSITGRNAMSVPSEQVLNVDPWEGWHESHCIETDGTHEQVDASIRVTSNLVALKSTQLAAAISPSIEITSEDLKTLDSAVSCFLNLSEIAISESHINTLKAILEEWEALFSNRKDEEKSGEVLEESSNWSSDGWDEGWENLPEEPLVKEGINGSASLHPLHTCWMEIMKKLVRLSQLRGVINLIDQTLSKSQGILLSENEAQSLFHLLVDIDCSMGLKIVLLLPYRTLWFQTLNIIEEKLKHGDISRMITGDMELLILILSSETLPSISTDPSYHKVFSYLCYSVGHLCRLCQEDVLKYSEGGRCEKNENGLFLFSRVLFPCFVSELVEAGQHLLAGFVISQWMHTHASFSFINVLEASLRKYLEAQLQTQQHGESDLEELDSRKCLAYTVSSLRGKLGNFLKSALSTLPSNLK